MISNSKQPQKEFVCPTKWYWFPVFYSNSIETLNHNYEWENVQYNGSIGLSSFNQVSPT